jgi:exonuclease III
MTCHERLPILMGGDVNILRHAHGENEENFDGRWHFLFNCVINGQNLRELKMSGRRYTWANSLPNPTYENLDIILISTEWELAHPLSTVVALPRAISDHTPLLIDMGQSSTGNNIPMFKFELGWLLRDGFMDMVRRCGTMYMIVKIR